MCMDACADICGAAGQSLGRLGAQQSLDSCVDVPTSGNECLEIGLTVDEAHGIQLLQLLLESHFGTLRLGGEGHRAWSRRARTASSTGSASSCGCAGTLSSASGSCGDGPHIPLGCGTAESPLPRY